MNVNVMQNKDFLNVQEYRKKFKNMTMDESGMKWKFADLKVVKVEKKEPYKFAVKTEYDGEYRTVNALKTGLPRERKIASKKDIPKKLKQAYKEKIPVSSEKYDDFVKMCNKRLIPSRHHDYFLDLPHKE